MKPLHKIFIAIGGIGAAFVFIWFVPGPIEGTYQIPEQVGDIGAVSHNFLRFNQGNVIYYMEVSPPPIDGGDYVKSTRGWEWTMGLTNRVEAVVEPHLLFMRLKYPRRPLEDEIIWREFRFWKTRRVLSNPEQAESKARKSSHPI